MPKNCQSGIQFTKAIFFKVNRCQNFQCRKGQNFTKAVAFVDILTENKLFVTMTFLKYVNKSEKIGNLPKKNKNSFGFNIIIISKYKSQKIKKVLTAKRLTH